MDGLARRALVLDRGLQFAFQIELGDLAAGSVEERVVVGRRGGTVNIGDLIGRLRGLRGAVDAEGREADGAVAQRVEEVAAKVGAELALRYKERVVGALVGGDDRAEEAEVVGVEVRRQDVDGGRGRLPDGDIGLLRAAGGILLTGRGAVAILQRVDGIGEPDVAVHRQRVHGLARGCNLADVVRGGVGGEALVGVGAKGFAPCAAGGQVHGARELRGNGRVKLLLRGGAEVADGADRAGLVLHLNHNDGVLRGVDCLDVTEQRGEGCLIGFEVGHRVGAHHIQQLAVGVLLARVGLRVGLDPLRNVVVLPVLPCSEPEQYEVELVLARLCNQQVHVGEVECPLGGLHLLPVDGGLDGVHMHGFSSAPGGGKRRGPRAGVVDLAAQDEERLAIDDKCVASILLLQMGNVAGLGRSDRGEERSEEDPQNRCD